MDACIAAFQRNWDERIAQSAEAICTLLKDCLACFESEQLARGETDDGVSAKVEKRVKDKIRENEERFRKGIRRSFRHTRISGPTLDLNLDDDLFSKETVSVFGMSKYLLAGVSASITATLAAMGDVAAGGASLGLFAAGGFVLGGIAGYWGANRLISVEVPSLLRPILPGRMKTHGRCITARPSPLSNLPWVLINRSIEFFHWASTWSHGRTDQPAAIIQADVRKASNTNNWTKEQRETAQRFIALALATIETGAMEKLKQYMPGKKLTPETVEREMRETLIAVLKTMTGFKR